jgi:transcriptional regulator with XRE-family HTH domain
MDRPALAEFLRSRRARVQPAAVGLPAGPRRRTPGLRREEVAQLAAITVDYYVRLEQARGPRPSITVLEALSRALRLSADERTHLFHLAGHMPPSAAAPSTVLQPTVQRLLERLDGVAAYVVDARWDLLAWNPLAAALLHDFGTVPPAERNLFLIYASIGSLRTLPEGDPPHFLREGVADLRASYARYPGDRRLRRLVERLRREQPLFALLWDEGDVDVRRSLRKHIDHPVVGMLELDYDVLVLPEPDQRLVVYTAEPGSVSEERLGLLRVIGTQQLTGGDAGVR